MKYVVKGILTTAEILILSSLNLDFELRTVVMETVNGNNGI